MPLLASLHVTLKHPSNGSNIGNYYNNDPYLSVFWNTLSMLFPEGEKFFVDSIKNYRTKVANNKQLSAEIAGFIGQESLHSREHTEINDILVDAGYDIDRYEWELRGILNFARMLPKSNQLAATCALEHFTGIMAQQLLEDKSHNGKIMGEMYRLWMWHALEETEHKCVSFDTYTEVSDSYLLRVTVMLAATVLFFLIAGQFYIRMLISSGHRNPIRVAKAGLDLAKLFGPLTFKYLDYFKPSFHPSQHDTKALVEEWRVRLFDANTGQLKDYIK